jgi:hypothetical protein
MTEREKELFNEMLAALRAVVNWYGMVTKTDAPAAIAKAKAAIQKADSFERGHLTAED